MRHAARHSGNPCPDSHARPTALDLFSGCGGLTLGMKLAGFRVLAAVEIDPLSVESYSLNHSDTRVWEADIRQVDPAEVMAELRLKPGELDLLAGCPPCQGFSTIRTKKRTTSVEDARNVLVFEFLRFARVFRPKTVILENVPGLTSYEGFRAVVLGLEELGLQSDFRVLDAADFGVPQRRRRMVLLGSTYGPVAFPTPDSQRITVRDVIGSMPKPGKSEDPLHRVRELRCERIRRLIASVPKDGGSRDALPERMKLACHKRASGFGDVYGRMAWDDVAPTITGGCVNPSKGRFLHPTEDRAITPREAAILQSFPSKYKFSLRCGKYGVARLIGNAFPPEFARRHAAMAAAHLAAQGRNRDVSKR